MQESPAVVAVAITSAREPALVVNSAQAPPPPLKLAAEETLPSLSPASEASSVVQHASQQPVVEANAVLKSSLSWSPLAIVALTVCVFALSRAQPKTAAVPDPVFLPLFG